MPAAVNRAKCRICQNGGSARAVPPNRTEGIKVINSASKTVYIMLWIKLWKLCITLILQAFRAVDLAVIFCREIRFAANYFPFSPKAVRQSEKNGRQKKKWVRHLLLW